MSAARRRLAMLGGATICALALSASVGASGIGPVELLRGVLSHADPVTRAILFELRLPRAVLAALVGAALGLSGCTFQALLRNPLAEPYVLGISGGAALGAVGAVVAGVSTQLPWTLPLGAFLGALLATAVVLGIARRTAENGMDTRAVILAGVVAGAFFNAFILLLLSMADAESFRAAVFWMMGNLSGASWSTNAFLLLLLVPTSLLILALARSFDLLARGEEVAFHLGVSVPRVKLTAYLAGSLMVAGAVAAAGIIGFVGLIVPHAVRIAWGSEHRFLLPASMLAGSGFLLMADTVARVVAAPAELPTGVITALAGVPVFLVLLVKKGAA